MLLASAERAWIPVDSGAFARGSPLVKALSLREFEGAKRVDDNHAGQPVIASPSNIVKVKLPEFTEKAPITSQPQPQ